MRVTTITQFDVPSGRIRHFSPIPEERVNSAVPISLDQQRHVSAGDRPGSWTSIALRLPTGTSADAIAAAWMRVVARHGALRTVFSATPDGELQLGEHRMAPGRWEDAIAEPGADPHDTVRDLLDRTCRPFARPAHRLVLIEPPQDSSDPRPMVILASDHSHVDMWSMAVLARDLMDGLGTQSEANRGEDAASARTDAAIASFAEHTRESWNRPAAPASVMERWRRVLDEGGGRMPAFPLGLGDVTRPVRAVVEVRDALDAHQTDQLAAVATAHGVRKLAEALSVMTGVTRAMSGAPLRAVFPIHSRYDARWRDAVGWFVANSVLDCDDAAPAACAASVKDALELGSYPLAPVFAPYGGMPGGPGMFALSWLDTRRMPVHLDDALDASYVSADIPVNDVMVWYTVSPDGLHVRARYPDTPEARTNVGSWLDAVIETLRARVEGRPEPTVPLLTTGAPGTADGAVGTSGQGGAGTPHPHLLAG